MIVAAGSSTRMGGVDKLAEPLGGQAAAGVVGGSAWRRPASVDRVVVVTRADRVAELSSADWLSGATVVAGGAERTDSVRAGVEATSAEVVLVHDGARPLASSALADAVANAAAEHGAAVPAMPVADSLKRADGGWLRRRSTRTGLVRTQTPQGARRDLLFERSTAPRHTLTRTRRRCSRR